MLGYGTIDGWNRDEGKKERENIQIPSIVPT